MSSNAAWHRTVAVIALPALVVICSSSGRAQDKPTLATAVKPLIDGIPEVAVARLRALLATNPPAKERNAAVEKLAEALLAAQQPAEVLDVLAGERVPDESANFWRAQALASLGRYEEALPLYEAIAKDLSSQRRTDAVFGAAEMLRAVGHFDDALARLALLLGDGQWRRRAELRMAELHLDTGDSANARRILSSLEPKSAAERKIRRFLQGRAEMVEHHPERALAIFEPLLKHPEGASHALVIATLFSVAEAHLRTGTAEAGDDFIEDFIEHQPQDADLPRIFAKLDELYRSERRPARSELERWTREPEQPRRAFAQWYLARIELRAGHRDKAVRLFGDLRGTHPNVSALAPAFLDMAQVALDENDAENALLILNEAQALQPDVSLRERIGLASAEAQYRTGQVERATVQLEQIANSTSDCGSVAAFNAALGRLDLGDRTRFVSDYAQVEKRSANAAAQADLRLQEGLSLAARGDPAAAQSLERFVRAFATNPRVSEALVALAELAFHRAPPALDEARSYLRRAAESKPTPAAAERADYLAIWIEDAATSNQNKVVDLANAFIERYVSSLLLPQVRMKLAETYFRRQDFASAQTQFELLAQQNSEGAWAEKALFFAAESSALSMGQHSLERAVTLLDETVQRKGEFRWTARNQQAMLERKLGKPQDALLLYEEVLKGDAKPSEKREALCGRGDIYFDLGANERSNYDRAIESYAALATDLSEPGHWRNQALFKKGVCLEKKGDFAAALAAFYEIIERPNQTSISRDLFWFYKAGFNAARLLEQKADWKSAAAIYDKLVAAAGVRSEEAKARLNRLRLEHFLWQE